MTCTIASHEAIKARAARGDRSTDIRALLASLRPWPGADLVIAECHHCHSTLSWDADAAPEVAS